jgi:uncharacterized protein YyaL (SSP411 family)
VLRLHGYTGEERYFAEARRALNLLRSFVEQQPFAFSHMLEAIDLYQRGATEIAIVGERGTPGLDEWIERLGLLYLPNRALFLAGTGASAGAFVPEAVRGKSQIDGKLTAYVCRERTCSAPITSFDALRKELMAEFKG